MAKSQEDLLRSLVEMARKGDRRAYGRLFKLCYEEIYDYIYRRTGNRSDAEDLTMQVFMHGLRTVESYEERGYSVKAWLFKIAHNEVVDNFRKQKGSLDIDEVADIPVENRIEEDIQKKDDLKTLYGNVTELPKAQAEVLILRFIEDRSVAETAYILGKKEVTVRALQFKGIKNLREKLGESEKASGLEEGKQEDLNHEKQKKPE
ncbi:MAG: sigma-70 family RNA polymerase sigma factor [Actinomycetota bacterium]|nr:sigma-70 family RNA polymerase sigma factor [Actinomycetota bacterium]